MPREGGGMLGTGGSCQGSCPPPARPPARYQFIRQRRQQSAFSNALGVLNQHVVDGPSPLQPTTRPRGLREWKACCKPAATLLQCYDFDTGLIAGLWSGASSSECFFCHLGGLSQSHMPYNARTLRGMRCVLSSEPAGTMPQRGSSRCPNRTVGLNGRLQQHFSFCFSFVHAGGVLRFLHVMQPGWEREPALCCMQT